MKKWGFKLTEREDAGQVAGCVSSVVTMGNTYSRQVPGPSDDGERGIWIDGSLRTGHNSITDRKAVPRVGTG